MFYFGEENSPQWFKSKFEDKDGIVSNTAEQFIMYYKAKLFNDRNAMSEILETSNPKKIKAIGKTVQNFDDKIWKENVLDIVTLGNFYKFSQDKLRNF